MTTDKEDLEELRRKAAERDDWKALAKAYEELCVCYRLRKTPSAKLFNTLDRLKAKLLPENER